MNWSYFLGREKTKQYLEERPDVAIELEAKIREKLLVESEVLQTEQLQEEEEKEEKEKPNKVSDL